MDHKEQIRIFERELQKFVDNFAEEFDLTYAEVNGALHYQIFKLETRLSKLNNKENHE